MEVDEFLAHHGVRGMKWGHRKRRPEGEGRPRLSKQDKRNARAKKFTDKAAKYQARIDELAPKATAKGFKNAHSRHVAQKQIRELYKAKRQALNDAEAKKQGKLSRNQKRVVIGASIVAALVASAYVAENLESGEFNRKAMLGKAALKRETFDFKKDANLAKQMTSDEVYSKVVKHINPNYGEIGTKMNCRRATFAYEMRRRGYDVKATRTTTASGQNARGLINALHPERKFQSTKMSKMKNDILAGKDTELISMVSKFGGGGANKIVDGHNPHAIFYTLAKQPNGSRGELAVQWSMGGAHSVAYEIFNGKPVIFDNQSGMKITNPDLFTKHLGEVSSAGFTRLDNVELNKDYLARWLKNA